MRRSPEALERLITAYWLNYRDIEVEQGLDDRFEGFLFAPDFLRALTVVPDRGIFGKLVDFGEARLLHLEVKDTSAIRLRARRGR